MPLQPPARKPHKGRRSRKGTRAHKVERVSFESGAGSLVATIRAAINADGFLPRDAGILPLPPEASGARVTENANGGVDVVAVDAAGHDMKWRRTY